jgi:hypothetical protein
MNKTRKSFIALLVAGAFFATTVLCCCVVKQGMTKKAACAHCASKTSDSKSQECCFSKASPMEMVKAAGMIHLLPWIAFTILSFIYLRPTPQLAYARYQNGPPGFVSQVPLYYRSRNIRI